MVFGSSGFEKRPRGGIVENYLYRAEDDFEANHHVKSICNPRKILGFANPHNPYYRKGFYNLDENGEILNGPISQSVKYDHIRVNHYFTKSKEEYLEKINRGKADSTKLRDMGDFVKHDQNDIYDDEIIRWKNKQ